MPAASNPFFAKRRTPSEIKTELLSRLFGAWYATVASSIPRESNQNLLLLDLLGSTGKAQSDLVLPVHQRVKQLTDPEAVISFMQQPAIPEEGTAATPDTTGTEAAGLAADQPDNMLLQSLLANDAPVFACLNPLDNAGKMLPLLPLILEKNADVCLLFPPENIKGFFTKGKAGKAMAGFLGEADFAAMQSNFRKEKSSRKREAFFITALEQFFWGKDFLTIGFRIGLPDKDQTDLLLVYATKNKAVYSQVKSLLLPYSDYQADGVPVFGANQHHQQQLLLFPEFNRYSIRNLMQDLLASAVPYNYKPIDKIADVHSIATPYIPENYQQAFAQLRDQGKITFINHKTLQPVKKATVSSLVKFVSPPS